MILRYIRKKRFLNKRNQVYSLLNYNSILDIDFNKITTQGGVYILIDFSKKDYKCYIGESNNLQRRFTDYLSVKDLKSSDGLYGIRLQIFKNIKYINYAILEIENDTKTRYKKEHFFITHFNSFYNGYNYTKDGKKENSFIRFLKWLGVIESKKKVATFNKTYPRLNKLNKLEKYLLNLKDKNN